MKFEFIALCIPKHQATQLKYRSHMKICKNNDRYRTIANLYHRCREIKLGSELTHDQIENFIFEDCHYCGDSPSFSATIRKSGVSYRSTVLRNGIDRKDSKIGYILNNCVTCCQECNYMKRDTHYDDFIELSKLISSRF